MNAKNLFVAVILALIAAPVATAGRDAASPSIPFVTEHTAGIFRASQPAPFVTEKVRGQWRTPSAVTAEPVFLSENTEGQSRTPVRLSAAPVLAAPDDGFGWGDAGVAATIALASLLIVSAGALAIRRRRLPAH
jgi:hypothetical protein